MPVTRLAHNKGNKVIAINEMFGRINADGNVDVLVAADGAVVTYMDAYVFPVNSVFSAHYEHPNGIVLTRADADAIGLEIEE